MKADEGGTGNPMGSGPEATQEHSGAALTPERFLFGHAVTAGDDVTGLEFAANLF